MSLSHQAQQILERLEAEYPDSQCALTHQNPFELLVATILAAQCTDKRVNMVTPSLFAAYPDAASLAQADLSAVESIISSINFFQAKAQNLILMAQKLSEDYDGEVPEDMKDLVKLNGVGRKTANVVRSVALGLPGFPVDTHVKRLSGRLGLTEQTDPVKIETELDPLVAPEDRGRLSLLLIDHGRKVCKARKPDCEDCVIADLCPSAFSF